MLYRSPLKEAQTHFKYWLTPDDELLEVHPSDTHEGFLYDYTGEDYAYHDALEDGWIRIIGISYITYFNCSGYDNKKFKRIYNALQKNFKLASYTDDIEVVDDKANKRYRYYGRKMKPVLSESIEQINTPEFKKWFGKSKVVDSSGKPLIVYHGSKDKFDTFDYSKMSWQTIQSQQGSGFYFTDNKRQASAYGKTGEFYLSIENPLILKSHSKNISFDQAMEIYGSGDNDWFFTDYLAFQLSKEKGEFSKEELLAEWIKKGMNYENDIFVVQNMKRAYKESSYGKMMKLFMSITKFDGLIQEVSGGLKVYVAYKPNQIKSATGNNRQFSLQSDNIYESHFKEKLLPGQVKGFTGKNTLVKEIENKKEFLELPNQCRGIVYKDKLYMTSNPEAYIMHEGLLSYLMKINVVNKNDVYNSQRKDLLDVYLRVVKWNNALILGDGLWKTKDNKNFILSFIPVLKKLGISLKSATYK